LSTIGSGVLGIVQGQAPAKGKAGLGNVAGASEEGDFSRAIASLHGREGEGGRKGARISISGTAGGEDQEGEQAGDPRVKVGTRSVEALADALRTEAGEDGASFEEKAAALLEAAGRSGRRAQVSNHDGKTATENGEEKPSDEAWASATPTDVGNLLELLATQNTLPNAMVNGATAKSAAGTPQDARVQAGGKSMAKADAHADAAAKMGAADLADAAETGDVPQSDTDRVFRLIRADGKGRDIDMNISGAGDRATFRDANPTGPKGEAVTVVDARRYIGLAQTGNAAAVTSAITQDPEWTASLSATGGLSHAEAAATGKVVNTLKIQMHPIELGLVTATLRLHGDKLVVSLQVETGEAYRQLTDDQDAIVRALRGQGFAVDQVSVQLAPADRSANTQGDSQQQQQFSSQPQAREGGNGRQGGNGEGSGTFAREGASHEGNTSENASGLAGGQPQRSGGVYL
jgi:chemotaxis protein MotD